MASEKFHHFLSTGSGITEVDLTLSGDNSAVIEVELNWMGSGQRHYHLVGKYKRVSSSYGWIHIEQIEEHSAKTDVPNRIETFDLGVLQMKVRYEYFRLVSSPNSEHPDDLGLMHDMGYASWNDTFDMVLMLHPSVEARALEFIEKGDIRDSAEGRLVDGETIRKLGEILLTLDKVKFASIES